MHKIGCGSAIKVNFIALALHYLCNEQLKPFGKMYVFFLLLALLIFVLGLYAEALAIVTVVAIFYFYGKKNDNK